MLRFERKLHVTAWLLCTAVGYAACATHVDTHEGPEGPPLHVRLGPTIRLLPFQKWDYEARALIDAEGHVHVLAASSEPREVEEIVVGPDRVLERRVVTAISRSFAGASGSTRPVTPRAGYTRWSMIGTFCSQTAGGYSRDTPRGMKRARKPRMWPSCAARRG